MYFFKWLKYIIEVFLQPILCSLGIFTNILSVLVVKNKRKKNNHLNNFMYKHLMANALFNVFYCLINLFSLMNICIFPHTSFCSSIHRESFVQYFKIYVGLFLGELFKICSNKGVCVFFTFFSPFKGMHFVCAPIFPT